MAIAAVCMGAMVLAGCSGHVGDKRLKAIKARGTIVVLTRNAPTTYYIGRDDKPTGPEHDLIVSFAKSIGVKPKFVVKNSVSELLHALAKGEGDVVAAGITHTSERSERFRFGPSYQKVTQQVVCSRHGKRARSVEQLSGVNLEIISDSSYVERLQALKKKHPDLHWKTSSDADTEELLRRIWKGKLDCTVADSDIVAINRRFFPNLVVTFDLSDPQPLAWVLPKGAEGLQEAMQDWLEHYKSNGELKHVMQHYYAHVKVFDYVDTRAYVRRIKHRYPRYRKLFDKAADKHGLSPVILAAQGYQESHWNPHARSPTGVRGIMMLTQTTARSLGVKNRLDPRQSINGGAKYLAHLESRLSDDIDPRDRIWFALAAYNIGFAHLRDARKLVEKLGHDPNDWNAVKGVLPLLGKRKYYSDLDHGYARGTEAVRYTQRIRNYAGILRHKTRAQSQ
ncbi:MAG TPA: membrane-bound lytic murein transglycosylase MltF [Gammaproteobacteria bacterium]|nr:membrane-bound lytic murein transglycosylase MltF [Gammaproteobacteria bacterium]